MFQPPEPSASDRPAMSPGAESLPLLPKPETQGKDTPPHPRALTPEKVRHMLYGSLAAIDRTIKILHAYGYADPNDWSDPIPVPPGGAMGEPSPGRAATKLPNQWMVIMTKTVLLE